MWLVLFLRNKKKLTACNLKKVINNLFISAAQQPASFITERVQSSHIVTSQQGGNQHRQRQLERGTFHLGQFELRALVRHQRRRRETEHSGASELVQEYFDSVRRPAVGVSHLPI